MLQPGNERTAVFQHSVLCQTFLPYKNLGDDVREIERRQGRAILSLEAGKIYNPYTQNLDKVGLPYGAQARLILSYINTQAVKSQSPVIDVEDSMTAFIKRIGLSTDGMTIKRAKEQLKRLSGTRMSIGFLVDEENKRGIQTNLNLIQSFDIWLPEDDSQKILWTSTVRLSDDYFNSLVNHAIPLDERALAALSNNALALDIYSWLSQRLHRIQKGSPDFVPWQALKEQFGEGYNEMFKFKQKFRQTLQIVQNQYKDAKLEEDKNKGFLLYNSPTPIPKQQIIIPQIGILK
jgi:Plasmid encoded RepA protein